MTPVPQVRKMRPNPSGKAVLTVKDTPQQHRRLSPDARLWLKRNIASCDGVDARKMPTEPDEKVDPGERPFGAVSVNEIRQIRSQYNLSREDVAEALGVSVEKLQAWENGTDFEYTEMLRRYVAAGRHGAVL